jgi:hypothetical protein
MAKTFIGELILRFKDEAGAGAKKTAAEIDASVNKIEAAGRRLSAAPWGVGFQRQLDKIGASSSDIDRLRRSWDALYSDMSGKNLSKALQKSEIAGWKTATLGHFAQQQQALREEMKKTEAHAKSWRNSMNNIFKAGLVTMGAYTGAYMGGVALRQGLTASSEWEREKYRQQMASIPQGERNQIAANSIRLGSQYPSVGITDIAELGRSARSMMGDTNRGMEILPDLIRGMVTLQSTKGTDVAVEEMRGLLRGIDNAGQNAGGELGVQNTREIIAGMVRAAQIEGSDLDVGKLFGFARRGKIAVPGLSTQFLATTAPAFMQDMTAEGFGTALSSAYQAFVIGSSAVASKSNIANQMALGIRNENGLIGDKQFGTDPYAWVKAVLMPALTKSGVDLTDDTAVAKKIAGLSRNTNATSLLARMVQQSPQTERLISQYGSAMGPDAAETARNKDPFVAFKGFMESLNNLAAAVGEDVMPTIVSGLNSLANGINALQGAWRDGDPMAKVGITAGIGAGAFSAWKITSAIWGLITAGTNLNAAAVSLEAAAISLGGPGVVGKGGKTATKGWGLAGLGFGSLATIFGLGALQTGSAGPVDPEVRRKQLEDSGRKWLETHPFMPNRRRAPDPYAVLAGQRAASGGGNPLQDAVDNATRVGGKMKDALSVTAKPVVDTSSIDAAQAKAEKLVSTIRQAGDIQTFMGGSINGTNPARQINRSMADHGVTP